MLGAVRCVARISSHPALLAAIASLAFLPAAAQAELSVTLVGNDARGDRPMTFVATGTTSATTEIYGKLRHARACRRAVLQHRCPQRPVLRRSDGRARGDQQGRSGLLRALCLPRDQLRGDAARGADAPRRRATQQRDALLAGPVQRLPRCRRPGHDRRHDGARQKHLCDGQAGRRGPLRPKPRGRPRLECVRLLRARRPARSASLASQVRSRPGRYALCAWLQEGRDDTVAEATASAVLDIVAPVPALTSLDLSPPAFPARSAGGFTTEGRSLRASRSGSRTPPRACASRSRRGAPAGARARTAPERRRPIAAAGAASATRCSPGPIHTARRRE